MAVTVSVVALAVIVSQNCLYLNYLKKKMEQSRGSPWCVGHHRRGDRGSTEMSSSRDCADVKYWEETSLDS